MTDPPRQPDFVRRILVPILVVVALGTAVAWWLRPPATPAPAKPVSAPGPPMPAVEPAPVPSAVTPRPAPKPVSPVEQPAEAPPPEPAPAKPTLHVSSDVEGANVFVDRQFVGKTPLETSDVPAGRHDLNVSAPGYDGVSESVDVAGSGATRVQVSLKTVRLDASVPVVHKHAMGSCEGILRADPKGLRYEASNPSDAFQLGFDELETFTVDYAQKVLRVKKRGGRTWNFTTRAPNADPLLSFQHDVDHARERLARR